VPELPEVETTVRDLRPHVVGRRVVNLRVGKKRLRLAWQSSWKTKVVGARVAAVHRRGKWIVVDFAEGGHLVVHLGMTGRFRVFEADETREAHTHLVFVLDDGRELRFRDPRRFGSVRYFADRQSLDEFFIATALGPEPSDLNPTSWRTRLAATRRSLKAVLLDQGMVAGVGNIYADEALFEAKLHPARSASRITAAEAERLRKAVANVIERAVEHRGSSIRDYLGGGYQNEHRVYDHTGDPCPRCRTPIERLRLAGRSTHYCPRCQPKGGRRIA
jgi:formamidopyrimidine-DNA glycosylase